MQRFRGDLLIGGMRIKQLRCELEQEELDSDTRDWLLTGHLYLTPDQANLLELNRLYRLQLEDGRGGAVHVTRVLSNQGELLADFSPQLVRQAY